MKIPREARKLSRELFGKAVRSGKLDPDLTRDIADLLVRKKPRHYVQVLKEFTRLVRLELSKYQVIVNSAEAVDSETEESIRQQLLARFPHATEFIFQVNPALIGGMRVQLGSDVWDGSVRSRIEQLRQTL